MPARHSTPASPSATTPATRSSHGSPACTVSLASAPSRRASTPRDRSNTTSPGHPSSATTRLLPPPSSSTGSPAASASATVDAIPAAESAVTSRAAGPPTRSVVSSANATPDRTRLTLAATSWGSPDRGNCAAVPSRPVKRAPRLAAGRARPVLVRALNVLRQYDERSAAEAWRTMRGRLAPGGLLVEGSCDELGRRATWVALDGTGPLTLTLSARVGGVGGIERPSDLADRLPRALIHRNRPGEPVHALLGAFDQAWVSAAGYGTFGPRQRWAAAVERLADDGWPVVGGRSRWRLGEMTIRWSAVWTA